jgi:alpha-tubulin suppressor-like RCC1 family protein
VFASVSAGASHTCAVTTSGMAYCWGDNSNGQLGTGAVGGPQSCTHDPNPAVPCSTSPTAVVGGLRFASVSAGGDYTCGITTGGVTYCWGSNKSGELGNGSTVDSSVPVKVAGQP